MEASLKSINLDEATLFEAETLQALILFTYGVLKLWILSTLNFFLHLRICHDLNENRNPHDNRIKVDLQMV